MASVAPYLGAATLRGVDAQWRAANYLSVGQIYLLANPLLRAPLALEHIKPRLLGHWGTTPGLNLIYAQLNRAIRQRQLEMLLDLLLGACDLVVLARYMQVLSAVFLDRVGVPVIYIHHPFLPAFAGAGPYGKARERGVKLIGATAHYVTEELDAGPIIEQDVVCVTHADSVGQLTPLGAEVERNVFARAVQWHCEDRVVRQGGTTVVF